MITSGIFKNDKRTGKGVFFRSNGEKYEGEFKDGKRHGVGISHVSDDKTGQEKVLALKQSASRRTNVSCQSYREQWENGSLIRKDPITEEAMMQILENELDMPFIQAQRERGVSFLSSSRSVRTLR